MAETAAGEELMRKQHRDPPASAGITYDHLGAVADPNDKRRTLGGRQQVTWPGAVVHGPDHRRIHVRRESGRDDLERTAIVVDGQHARPFVRDKDRPPSVAEQGLDSYALPLKLGLTVIRTGHDSMLISLARWRCASAMRPRAS